MKSVKYFLFASLVLTVAAQIGAGAVAIFPKPLSPRIANYDMEVKLNPDAHILRGREIVTWHNKTGDVVGELWFHLYLNAFRDNRSTFLRDDAKKAAKHFKKGGWGFIEVTKITTESGEDVTGSMEFVSPDDGNPFDRTVFKIPASRPVRPGETVLLNIDFISRLPDPPVARAGAHKKYHFAGQWFPKIAVFQDGEWNCHQYHKHTEFFADYGVYNVRITVPGNYAVGATGVENYWKDNGDGTATHVYRAEDVHDFAWTASPNFVEFRDRTQDVDIRLLMQKGHKNQWKRHMEAAKRAVEHFQDWYGDYPYPNLTVVDPGPGALMTGGMEYPTLITAGTFTAVPRGVRMTDSIIIHEFGHQYWYGLVGSNEFEDSWLDEGVNTYCEIKIMRALWGKNANAIDFMGLKADDMQLRRYSYVVAPDLDPVNKNAWEYYNGLSYRVNSYSRPAMALLTLDNYLGGDKMREILAAYLEKWRFKHPKTRDFVDVANDVAGENLDWFFDQWLHANAALDYSVDLVSSEKVPPPAGMGRDMELTGEGTVVKKRENPARDGGQALYQNKVWIRRRGDFIFPVNATMEFDDGEKRYERWDGRSRWLKIEWTGPEKLVRAAVDPNNLVPLDINMKNNSLTAKRFKKKARKGVIMGMVDSLKFALHPDR